MGSFWKKFIFGSFDLQRVFWELKKFMHFLEKAIFGKIVADFQSFKTSSRTPKINVIWPSESVVEVVIQRSYFGLEMISEQI